LVEHIRNHQFHFSVGKTGRCFNAITSLKRNLRSCLRLEGEPVGGVDIVSAQPSLLVVLMQLKEREKLPTYIQSLSDRLSSSSLSSCAMSRCSGLAGLLRSLSDDGPVLGPDAVRFADLVSPAVSTRYWFRSARQPVLRCCRLLLGLSVLAIAVALRRRNVMPSSDSFSVTS
jgi:hypothetical protein